MSDLIAQAQGFATRAHQQVGQRRKYSGQPYDVHLAAVAALVASVTDDAEMIAAAWLHDVAEDTTVTLEDLGREFGATVQALVEQLTDVSRASDGNRAARKAIDRRHLAAASPRAKTIKLADLIDNCEDITRHDPRFAGVFLREMAALLAELADGDATLLQRARTLHAACVQRLRPAQAAEPAPADQALKALMPQFASPRMVRAFRETFTAGDVCDALRSFDVERPAAAAAAVMRSQRLAVAGLRHDGSVRGQLRLEDLALCGDAACGTLMQPIAPSQMLDAHAPLIDVFGVLTRHERCFVSAFDAVTGVIERDAVNKPVVRMWLFGVITLYEMGLVRWIQRSFAGDSWQQALPAERLQKALDLQQERERRNQHSDLIDCLQFADKARLMLEHPPSVAALGLGSKRVGKQFVKELESLRNHLVHAQDIVSHDWAQIIRTTQRVAALTSD